MLSVNGFINASDGTAAVDIKHVQAMGAEVPLEPEAGATVRIITNQGKEFTLLEGSPGHYSYSGIDINFSAEYTLLVSTAGGRQLESKPIQLQRTSAIKAIEGAATGDSEALAITVTSENNGTQSPYYAWDYTETYEYTVKYFSGFKRVNQVPVQRTELDQVYRCWRTASSTKIVAASTLALKENVVQQYPIALIPKATHQLSIRYCILVRQRSVSLDEYDFLRNVKKTTESVGGLFDPMPFPVIGNIVETSDTKMPALGYFSGSEVTTRRSFFSWEDLPDEIKVKPPFPPCEEEQTCDVRFPPNRGVFAICLNLTDLGDHNILTVANTDARGNPFSYKYAPSECADCRYYGGVTTRPDFW